MVNASASDVAAAAAEAAKTFSGSLLLPAADGYDTARRVHNGFVDKRPALIAQCIGAADIAGAGTALVTVVTPPPGGGTSVALPFTISGPPVLTVSATNVAGGANVTATLTNGAGGGGDWLALAPTNAPGD